MTEEKLVTLRLRVAESKYVWVRLLNGTPVEVSRSPGGPDTMTDGSAWYHFLFSDDVPLEVDGRST